MNIDKALNLRDAHVSKGTCVHCKQVVINPDGTPSKNRFYSEAGIREYTISGVCEICFDGLFKE